MKAVITGGTGLVGRQLLAYLGHAAVLTRSPSRAARALGAAQLWGWDPLSGPAPSDVLSGADVVFNLAGESLAKGRWSAAKKQRIRDSRVIGTRNLVLGMATAAPRPRTLISASAVGYYGDRADEVLDERSPAGNGFLPRVCADWEAEAIAAERLGVRVVCLRIGVVLSSAGGALARMLTPFKLGLGGRFGSGRQWVSWIQSDDLVNILLHVAQTETLSGAINAVSPNPLTNADLTMMLGRTLRRPTLLPLPRAALRVALGESSQLLVASQRVVPRVVEGSGYAFRYPELGQALHAIFRAPDQH